MKYKMLDADVRDFCLEKARQQKGLYEQALDNVFVNGYKRLPNQPYGQMQTKDKIKVGIIDYLEHILKNDYYTRQFAFKNSPKEVEDQTFMLLNQCKMGIDECFRKAQ